MLWCCGAKAQKLPAVAEGIQLSSGLIFTQNAELQLTR